METQLLPALLRANPYPGRGILLGRSADGQSAVAAYFIMGRSENSRNRVFVETEDGIRTQAHDPSRMTDPSLIIYHPSGRWAGGWWSQTVIKPTRSGTISWRAAPLPRPCAAGSLNQTHPTIRPESPVFSPRTQFSALHP